MVSDEKLVSIYLPFPAYNFSAAYKFISCFQICWLLIVRQPNPEILESGKKLGKVLIFRFWDSLNPIEGRHKQWCSATVQENFLFAM